MNWVVRLGRSLRSQSDPAAWLFIFSTPVFFVPRPSLRRIGNEFIVRMIMSFCLSFFVPPLRVFESMMSWVRCETAAETDVNRSESPINLHHQRELVGRLGLERGQASAMTRRTLFLLPSLHFDFFLRLVSFLYFVFLHSAPSSKCAAAAATYKRQIRWDRSIRKRQLSSINNITRAHSQEGPKGKKNADKKRAPNSIRKNRCGRLIRTRFIDAGNTCVPEEKITFLPSPTFSLIPCSRNEGVNNTTTVPFRSFVLSFF